MNKLEDGMYVRTKYGINKIIEICCEHYSYNKELVELEKGYIDDDFEYRQFINKKDIKMASFNIIDLVQVGDYVNGMEVTMIGGTYYGRKDKAIYCEHNGDKNWKQVMIYDDEIKSIVTKEMFEGMKYEVE